MKSPVHQLQKRKKELLARFLSGNEPHFLTLHAELLDEYFHESFARSAAGPRMGMEKNPYAIMALGGYGRKEQCLYSDIDVLLLFKKKIPDQANALIQEGRISHRCDSPDGLALEGWIRSIVLRLEEALKSGLEFGGTHQRLDQLEFTGRDFRSR